MCIEESSEGPFPGTNKILKSTDGGINWQMIYNNFLFKDSLIKVTAISYPTINFCIITTDKNWYIKNYRWRF